MTPDERFDAKIQISPNGCILFTAAKQNGYGVFSLNGRSVKAHRFAYKRAHGSIPTGLTVDHECHNQAAQRGDCRGGEDCPHRACVNPEHLVARTSGDNSLRGLGPAAKNARKVLCSEGHRLPPDRRCRVCSNEDAKKWQAENLEYMRRKVECPRCHRPRSAMNMPKHLQSCMVPGRRRSDRERPGAVQCACGLWVSKTNLSRHRKTCVSQYVYFDEGAPDRD